MRATWPTALLALALLTACGPDPQPPAQGGATTAAGAPTSTSAQSGGSPQCPANSVLASTLGITVTRTDAPARFGTTSIACGYDGTMADGNSANVTLRLQIRASASDYADFRQKSAGFTLTDKSGVGDEAFTYSFGPGNVLHTIVSRKGDLLVYVSSQASFDQEVALLNVLFQR